MSSLIKACLYVLYSGINESRRKKVASLSFNIKGEDKTSKKPKHINSHEFSGYKAKESP